MSKHSLKPAETIQTQVEQLTAEAKKLNSVGQEGQALAAYREAAELMPGAPWLQHRTAELARKLNQPEAAALHYWRAGKAFIGAGFPKRALAPLRTAWGLYIAALPADPSSFAALTRCLAELQCRLGFSSEGMLSIAAANQALAAAGCAERAPQPTELEQAHGELQRASDPPVRARAG